MFRDKNKVRKWLQMVEAADEFDQQAETRRSEAAAMNDQAAALRREAATLEAEVFTPAGLPPSATVIATRSGEASLSAMVRESLKTFGPLKINDIAAMIDRTPMQANGVMAYMLRKGRIIRLKGGLYALADKG